MRTGVRETAAGVGVTALAGSSSAPAGRQHLAPEPNRGSRLTPLLRDYRTRLKPLLQPRTRLKPLLQLRLPLFQLLATFLLSSLIPSSLLAEPAGAPPKKDDLDKLFEEDEIKDVEFRFRTRFPKTKKPKDETLILYCYRIKPDEAPTIDGKIAVSEVWAKNIIDNPELPPEQIRVDRTNEGWVQCVKGTMNRRQTVTYMCYDDEKLYVCFVAEEPDKRKTRMEVRPAHDVWWDDCVEAFFEIGDVNGGGQRFQFLANVADRNQFANNSHWKMSDYEWKGEWGAKRWIVELAIPFRNFKNGGWQYKGPPKRGELWGLKLCREGSPIVAGGEERMFSVWQYIPIINFSLPEYSGMLVFDDRNCIRNEDLTDDTDKNDIPDGWEFIKSEPQVKADFKITDGAPRLTYDVRDQVEAVQVRQKFATRTDTFYEARASLKVAKLEGEAFIEIYEKGFEPLRRIRISDKAQQSHKFQFRADRDKEIYFALTSRGGTGEITIERVRIEQQLFTVPEGVLCLTNNSARKDFRYVEVIKKQNEELKKKGQPPIAYEEGAYTYWLPDTKQEYFPDVRPRRVIQFDRKGEGKPEKEVMSGWVPFSKGSLTEGRGKDDVNEVFYCSSKFGTDTPGGIDLVFDFKKNYFIEMLEVFPFTSGLRGLDIYVRPDGEKKDFLIWKMNGAGVLNPVREMMVAKVRTLDSVGRYVRLNIRFGGKLNVKEVRIWGRPQGTRKDTDIRHFRWKDGIVVPKKEFTQMKRSVKPFILPLPRELKFDEGSFAFKPDQPIVFADNDQDRRTAEILANDLKPYGIKPELMPDIAIPVIPEGAIWIGTSPTSSPIAARLKELNVKVTQDDPGPEGYVLVTRPGIAVLAGSDPAGTIYARDSFMQLLEGSKQTGIRVPGITVRDWPNVRVRSLIMLYAGGLQSGRETDESVERFIRTLCRYRYNSIYMSNIPPPGRRRLAADFNITVIQSTSSGAGSGAAREFATDETYAHVTSDKFDYGSRVNPNPAHPGIYYNMQNRIYELTQNPLARFNHVGHDEMAWVTSGSRWNESRLALRRNMSGGDLFAEMILREHDMLKRVRRDTVTLNTVLTTHGAKDRDEYGLFNRAYPLIARDITIDNYHAGSGKFSDPFYSNTSGFEHTIYIWRRPKPGELWNNQGVAGYWLANWSAFSFGAIIREFYGNSSYWASRGVLESQFSWNPYEDLVKAQPDREDIKIGTYDDLIASSSIRTTELLQGYRYPSWRKETKKNYRTLDLRPFINWSHIDDKLLDNRGWVDKGTNYDLSRLPTGKVSFCEVPFEILSPKENGGSSVVMLQNRSVADGGWGGARRKVSIPVGQSVASITFIRATMEGGGPAPIYEANYADGGYAHIPMIYTGWNGGGKLRAATRQNLWPAWMGDAPCGDPLILYAFEWVNPHPGRPVKEMSIRFAEPGNHRYSEALFAMTTLETAPIDVIEWQSRPHRTPILTLSRPFVDALPSFNERIVYGQRFSFPHGKPIVKSARGKVKVASARAFNPADGRVTKPTSDGYVIPYSSHWANPFLGKSQGRYPLAKGGTFEVRLATPIQASAFSIQTEGTYHLELQISPDGTSWKKAGEGWGSSRSGSQGLVFGGKEQVSAFRMTIKIAKPYLTSKLTGFSLHE